MASLVLGAVGAGIGFLIGGPAGAAIGWAVGSAVGSLFFQKGQTGPQLKDLHVQTSDYGKMIPIIYGTMRVAGVVMWADDLKKVTHTSGGKGSGPKVTTYSYTDSFAVILSEGPVTAILRIWANGTIIYDARPGGLTLDPIPVTLYLGTTTQNPDPTMEAVLGVGFVPAMHGYAYAVFTDFDLSQYGNALPQLNFEVQVENAPNEVGVYIVSKNSPVGPWQSANNPTAQLPYISAWPAATTDIRVRSLSTNTIDLFKQDLTSDGTDTAGANDAFPIRRHFQLTFPPYESWNYFPIGMFNGQPVWYQQSHSTGVFYPTGGDGTHDPAIAVGSVTLVGTGIVAGFDVASIVTGGLYVSGACISSDQNTLFLFTAPTHGANPTVWWKITYNGTNYVVSGTGSIHGVPVNSSLAGVWGPTALGTVGILAAMVAENDGMHFWQARQGGMTSMYYIDSTGLLNFDPVSGTTLPVNIDTGYSDSFELPSLFSPKIGYCGYVGGQTIALLARLATGGGQLTLADVVSDISVRAGLTTGQIDVTALVDLVDGYAITQQSACRDDITPLQAAYYFDGVESNATMKFVKRGAAPALTIADTDTAAHTTGSSPPAIVVAKRAQDVDLPVQINVNYLQLAADYQIGSQYSRRIAVETTQLANKVDLAITLSDQHASAIAWTLLTQAWAERETFTFDLPRKYWYLEPTDVIIVHGYEIRIISKKDKADGTLAFEGCAALSSIWSQGPVGTTGSGFKPSPPPGTQPTELLMLNIPLLTDTDTKNGPNAAMCGTVAGQSWGGATLYESIDVGVTYDQIGAESVPNVIGVVNGVIPTFGGGNMFDEGTIIDVTIGNGGGQPEAATEGSVLNGMNMALCGREIIQFKNVVQVGPSEFQLSGLLRGRRGTEWAMQTHADQEVFVILPVLDIDGPYSDLGQARLFKAVSSGQSLQATSFVEFTNDGSTLRPYSPVLLDGAQCDPFDGSVQIDWTRRTRISGQWVDFTDVPVSEPSEEYVLQIWDSTFTTVARIVTGLASPAFTYTHAMQVTDFGANQKQIFVTVGQVGTYKLGVQAHTIVDGAGSTNDVPLNPQPPYNSDPPPPTGGCTLPEQTSSFTWGTAPSTVTNASADDAHTWVISFTTGVAVAGLGQINLGPNTGATPVSINAVLSASPCGAPLAPDAVQSGTSPLLLFYMTNNPSPTQFPTLLPSTTYYVSANLGGAMDAKATLQIPVAGGSGGGGGGGGGGSACVGFNVVNIEVPWDITGPVVPIPQLGPNDAVVLHFKTGAAVPSGPQSQQRISIFEFQGPVTTRTAVVATQPCVSTSDVDPSFGKSISTDPNFDIVCGYAITPLGFLNLNPFTDYYITVTNRDATPANTCSQSSCGAAVELFAPH
ncbi:MAG TPA: phage tail protein [Vicinamibacterales bacterium]|jgi:hypothetical protein|nr:phage tail protein [Vicinamibacterales bacterium]